MNVSCYCAHAQTGYIVEVVYQGQRTQSGWYLSKDEEKYIQQVFNTCLYYANVVAPIMLVVLSSIATEQTNSIKKAWKLEDVITF